MKRFTLTTIALTAVAGFAAARGPERSVKTVQQRLPGKWEARIEIDEGKMVAYFRKKGASAATAHEMVQQSKRRVEGETAIHVFEEDGTSLDLISSVAGPKTEKGKWKVVKQRGNTATLKLTEPDGQSRQVEIVFQNDDRAEMKESDWLDYMRIVLERVVAEPPSPKAR